MRLFVLISAGLLGILAFAFIPGGESESSARVGLVQTPPNNPKELGWVNWKRDYNAGVNKAKAEGKPLFLLFQEVPGCSTCVGFGESVLAHPLLVEAIENEFVPVAIHNNKPGSDKATLKKFNEPAWNNPVVRFVDSQGDDLIPREDGVWSTLKVAERMISALKAAKRPVPDYLQWVVEDKPNKQATFSMACYWSGETCLGDIRGVTTTRAGWLNGREVVEVDFDENQISHSKLKKIAEERNCGDFVANAKRARSAKASDQKYNLRHSRFRYLPLTPSQATRVNSALGRGQSPLRWLSPKQRELFKQINQADETTLSGLNRPNSLDGLEAYQWKLKKRLSAKTKHEG